MNDIDFMTKQQISNLEILHSVRVSMIGNTSPLN